VLFFFIFLLVLPFAASAMSVTGGGTGDPWDSGLYQLYTILSGTTVRIIGFIMIIVAGVMIAVTEGQAVKRLMWVIGGLGIALNVPGVFNLLFPAAGGYEVIVPHLQVILSLL
jgi:type IV secretory pathway VirB2 component (pilin)